MNMRKCKECGKLFQPKGREQYCPDIHYRPCPICGTPVVAKYLSDPPRRCANCKATNKIAKHTKKLFDLPDIPSPDIITTASNESNTSTTNNQSSNEMSVSNPLENSQLNIEVLQGKDIRKYIGKDYRHGKGFIPNHVYELTIERDQYSYMLTAVYDYTEDKEKAITETFSSIISIDGHFQKLNQS